MALTPLANLINPEVLAQMVEEELAARVIFTNTIARVDNTLQGQPGNTITIPVWEYLVIQLLSQYGNISEWRLT